MGLATGKKKEVSTARDQPKKTYSLSNLLSRDFITEQANSTALRKLTTEERDQDSGIYY